MNSSFKKCMYHAIIVLTGLLFPIVTELIISFIMNDHFKFNSRYLPEAHNLHEVNPGSAEIIHSTFFLNGQERLMRSWLLVYLLGIAENCGITVTLCLRQQGVGPGESVDFRDGDRDQEKESGDMESPAYSLCSAFLSLDNIYLCVLYLYIFLYL